ncbi:MAG TPA: F0F1 ATP synthase subunit B' [Xanthobacteraceae bacterium]|jgi:F-type H+-transporting ATPase subunit b|nr:F0F1 ATP synthase subunit B' [Xanthobacteraceae bacterium]
MAGPTTYTEKPEPAGVFPPFQSEHYPSQLVWLTISFVLLYVLMSKIALPRIAAIMADRSKRVGDDLAAAERLKEQSNAAHAAYEKALADARSRAQGIASSTREQQTREAEAANKTLEAQLNEQLAAAERSIAATRTTAMGHVRGIAADTASAIVERLIGKAPASQDVAAALDASASVGKS